MRIATDIGGTFTDIVYITDDGEIHVDKAHTTPPNFEKGVIDVIGKCGIGTSGVANFVHGTTTVINALTERMGAKTGLITTKGFRDTLEIERGNRPDLFNFRFKKPTPFIPRYLRLEVQERTDYRGNELAPLNREDVKRCVEAFKKEGVTAVAVVFLHSYVNPRHEQEAVELIRELWPDVFLTASHEICREWREYERTNTAVLNSYVKPVAARYIDKLYSELEGIGIRCPKYIMQSNGGTTTFAKAKELPIHMVESGPVAGIYGAAMLGKLLGEEKVIGFDIGGTTAKCSLIDGGEVRTTTEYRIEQSGVNPGYPIKIPVVDIVEVGNGGGSIAWIDETDSLRVGPRSAGALPGPVAYGRGGTQPTTTDANLVVGRLSAKNFDMQVDLDGVRASIENIVGKHFGLSAEEAALGIIRVANSNMLNALKLVSVRKGYDPREFCLVAFGGGGPMHAAALAKELGIKKIIIPIAASVFSAWGMLMTDLRSDEIRTFYQRLDRPDYGAINGQWSVLEQKATEENSAKGIPAGNVYFAHFMDMRYQGQEHTVKVRVPNERLSPENLGEFIEAFHKEHEKNYSFRLDGSVVEIVNMHLAAFGKVEKTPLKRLGALPFTLEQAKLETRRVLFESEGAVETPVYDAKKLSPGMAVEGPAIVEERSSATLLYAGMTLTVDAYGNYIIETGAEE